MTRALLTLALGLSLILACSQSRSMEIENECYIQQLR